MYYFHTVKKQNISIKKKDYNVILIINKNNIFTYLKDHCNLIYPQVL